MIRPPAAEDPRGEVAAVAWNSLLAESAGRLAGAGIASAGQEARWLIEEISGMEGAELVLGLDRPATQRGVARLDALVARRLEGEPIQHVLGRWSFRHLDLLCDARALIPRAETEQVVELALGELDLVLAGRPGAPAPPGRRRALVADLGTGSGAIALSIATERPGTDVWAVEKSAGALAVARANLAGLGMAGTRVRLVEGSWFEALPPELAGTLHLVVTNPPYVGSDEHLPASVRDWEPLDSLVPGPTGLEAYEVLLNGVGRWLQPGGAFVAEIGATQGSEVLALANAAGLVDARVEPDLAGLDRTLVARNPY